MLEWVRYPNNTDATKTTYTYDSLYRLAKTQASVDTGGYTLRATYGYTDDLLTSITTRSTTYSFTYGDFALRSSIAIGSRTLASYSYEPFTHYLSALDYGNGDSVDYTYDQQGRITKETYEDGDTVTYQYDNNGDLAAVTDSATGITSKYYYDLTGRLMRYAESKSGYSYSLTYGYNSINNLTSVMEEINGAKRKTSYTYDDANRLTGISYGTAREYYTYDAFGRVATRINKSGDTEVLTDTLTYRGVGTERTTGYVHTLSTEAENYAVTYTYTYDDNGNILSVSDGSHTTTYAYDSANQLIRENNQAAGKTWVYT